MVREGLDLATVARRMEHSVTMTAQHYTHVIESCDPSQAMADVVADAPPRSLRGRHQPSSPPRPDLRARDQCVTKQPR